MAGTRRISVKLAGKEYPMTIRQAEEEKYRRAAQDINALISVYKTRFAAGRLSGHGRFAGGRRQGRAGDEPGDDGRGTAFAENRTRDRRLPEQYLKRKRRLNNRQQVLGHIS